MDRSKNVKGITMLKLDNFQGLMTSSRLGFFHLPQTRFTLLKTPHCHLSLLALPTVVTLRLAAFATFVNEFCWQYPVLIFF